MRRIFLLGVAVLLSACGGGDNNDTPVLSSDATLASLSISAGSFDQIFQSNLTEYTATVSLLRSTTTVTATIEDPSATLTVNGAAAVSATASGKVTLNVGNSAITITVTAADGVTTETYSIEVTRQTVASFAQRAYVKASNTDGASPGDTHGDSFGTLIALSGDTMAVSAPSEDSGATDIDGDQFNNSARNSGAVYIFARNNSGVWSQQAYIKPPITGLGGRFGSWMDLDGNTLVVKYITGINREINSEILYFYIRDDFGTWSQQGSILAPDFGTFDGRDGFGSSLALSGDTLAVGAAAEDSSATGINGDEADDSAISSGAAYVFTRDADGIWSRQAYIKASNTGGAIYDSTEDEFIGGDQFGIPLALDGDTLAVGAQSEDSNSIGINGDELDNSAGGSGAVYVFVRDPSGNWSQQAYIKASNTRHATVFSNSIALSGDTLAIGSRFETSNATGIDGDQTNIDAVASGAVYIFVRDEDDVWSQQAYIKSSNSESWDTFGTSLALSGDSLMVGARLEDSVATGVDGDQFDNSIASSGAAYLFTRNADGVWTQEAYLKASNTESTDAFGVGIALDGDIVAVGAVQEDSRATGINGDQSNNNEVDSGAIYIFE